MNKKLWKNCFLLGYSKMYPNNLIRQYNEELNELEMALLKVIIPGISEPPVRTLRATIPENERHIFR